MKPEEILICYQAATLQLLNLWQQNENPEALAEVTELLKNHQGAVTVIVHTRGPFGVELQVEKDGEQVNLLKLWDEENTVQKHSTLVN